jgi:ABC-type uncharacterized transport system substrate-binding protein
MKERYSNLFENILKYYRDYENSMDLKFEKGKAEGELEKAINIAQSMKKDGIPLETIVKYTGLIAQEIEKLSSNNPKNHTPIFPFSKYRIS